MHTLAVSVNHARHISCINNESENSEIKYNSEIYNQLMHIYINILTYTFIDISHSRTFMHISNSLHTPYEFVPDSRCICDFLLDFNEHVHTHKHKHVYNVKCARAIF